MNSILIFFISGVANYVLYASIIAAALVAIAWGIIKLGRIRGPVYRHMIWLWTLLFVLILPVIRLHVPKVPIAVLPSQTQSEISLTQRINIEPSTAPAEIKTLEIQSSTPADPPSIVKVNQTPFASTPFESILVYPWSIGFLFMLTRLFTGWYRMKRIVQNAEPVPDLHPKLNLSTYGFELLLSQHVDSPLCFGLFRPVILLPKHIMNNHTTEDLHMVLSHEFAHIERKDCWINIFQRLIEALLFFHPLVWYASSQLTQNREQICDYYVIAKGASLDDYANLLARIVEHGLERKSLHAVALFEGRLLSRIRSLLEAGNKIQIKASRRAVMAYAIVILVCLASGAISLETKSNVGNGLESNKTENQTKIASDDGPYLPDGLDSRQISVIIFDFKSKEKDLSWLPTLTRNEEEKIYSGIYFKATWRDLIDSGYVQKPPSQN